MMENKTDIRQMFRVIQERGDTLLSASTREFVKSLHRQFDRYKQLSDKQRKCLMEIYGSLKMRRTKK